jgi:hypothetical protein
VPAARRVIVSACSGEILDTHNIVITPWARDLSFCWHHAFVKIAGSYYFFSLMIFHPTIIKKKMFEVEY